MNKDFVFVEHSVSHCPTGLKSCSVLPLEFSAFTCESFTKDSFYYCPRIHTQPVIVILHSEVL